MNVEDKLRRLIERRGRGQWDRKETRELYDLLPELPDDLPRELALKVFEMVTFSTLEKVPAHLDDAIVEYVEARAKTREEAAFVAAGVDIGTKSNRHRRLRDLIFRTSWLPWAANAKRAQLAGLVAKHPEYVVGAQAAVAIGGVHVTSVYVPILALDASADSIDVMLPFLETASRERDSDLDWFRDEVVPLMSKTKAAKSVIEMLDAAVDDRSATSPALDFAKRLGMSPPPKVLQASVAFRSRKTIVYQVRFDSLSALWCAGRRGTKWQWRLIDPDKLAIEGAVKHVVRVTSDGVDRAKLVEWADTKLQ